MIVYAVVDDALAPVPLGVDVEVLGRRVGAERFIERLDRQGLIRVAQQVTMTLGFEAVEDDQRGLARHDGPPYWL